MRFSAIVMLVLAVALGAVSVYMARDLLMRQASEAGVAQKPSIELTTIVVAKRPMNFGDVVTREYLSEVEWPAKTLPDGAFTKISDLLGDGKQRVVLRAIQPNEPVLASKLSGAGGRATLSTILDKDMRAVTIRVNDVNGVAGFVLPGDRVDILLTRQESKNQPITDILLQNVKVLGIDQKANESQDKPQVARAVTLEVAPIDSQKLALASTVGSLSLALRHEANAEMDPTRTIHLSDLKSGALVPVKKPVQKVSTGKARAVTRKPRVVYVRPANPFANVTVVRGTKTNTSRVLKDKSPDTASNVTGLRKGIAPAPKSLAPADEEPAAGGPKIIVPES